MDEVRMTRQKLTIWKVVIISRESTMPLTGDICLVEPGLFNPTTYMKRI